MGRPLFRSPRVWRPVQRRLASSTCPTSWARISAKLADYRYQGWYVGAGIAYGYNWILNRHWNIEAEIGIGWAYTRFDKFRCVGCGKKVATDRPHNYYGPTKAAINIVYIF